MRYACKREGRGGGGGDTGRGFGGQSQSRYDDCNHLVLLFLPFFLMSASCNCTAQFHCQGLQFYMACSHREIQVCTPLASILQSAQVQLWLSR